MAKKKWRGLLIRKLVDPKIHEKIANFVFDGKPIIFSVDGDLKRKINGENSQYQERARGCNSVSG